MPRKTQKDVEIIIRYADEADHENKNVKTLQEIMQKLFNSYIMRTIQNISKGK